jgi:hypothetical protein
MFDLNGITINVIQILNPEDYPGAEYFNWFFTLVVVWGMFCFGVKILVDIINRS